MPASRWPGTVHHAAWTSITPRLTPSSVAAGVDHLGAGLPAQPEVVGHRAVVVTFTITCVPAGTSRVDGATANSVRDTSTVWVRPARGTGPRLVATRHDHAGQRQDQGQCGQQGDQGQRDPTRSPPWVSFVVSLMAGPLSVSASSLHGGAAPRANGPEPLSEEHLLQISRMHDFRMGEAAALLGVSVDTVRRWADDGRLVTRRTEGGHRLVDAADLARLAAALADAPDRGSSPAHPPATDSPAWSHGSCGTG